MWEVHTHNQPKYAIHNHILEEHSTFPVYGSYFNYVVTRYTLLNLIRDGVQWCPTVT